MCGASTQQTCTKSKSIMKKLTSSVLFASALLVLQGCATPQDEQLAGLPDAKCDVLGSNIPKKNKACGDQTVDPRAVRDLAESRGSAVAPGSSR
jgi:hypothetical protein